MYKDLLQKAKNIQKNNYLGIAKDEKDYAFTFIYPPTQMLYELKDNPHRTEKISKANLYIHIPYCTGRCTYCYFGCYSIASAPYGKSKYIEALCREMKLLNEVYGKIELCSIHFGGGTPSILNEDEINRVFFSISENFLLCEDIEITFETSPETLTKDKINILIQNGVNRLNIGIQTLNDQLLKSINRRHDSQKALNSIYLAQEQGLTNINVDVMYGLYGQTIDDWRDTLRKVLNIGLQSISTYRLRIHPKGQLSSQLPTFNEMDAIKMYISMLSLMDEYSYFQCSSHKFAIKEEFAQKQIINKRGITNNTLISVGMAAYGYIGRVLYWNEREMEGYIKKINNRELPYSIGYVLDETELMAKACVLGIHNVNGINKVKYRQTFGEDIYTRYGDIISKLREFDLIEDTTENIKPSQLGMVFADEIAVNFYSDTVKKRLAQSKLKYGIFFDKIL